MKLFHITAFDDNIAGISTWYSPQEHNDRIALADVLVLQAIATNVTGTGVGLAVRVEHSANGQNWVSLQHATNPEIVTTDLVNNPVSVGYVGGLVDILLGYTRLKVTLTAGTSPQCRLKIMVTGRTF